MSPEIRLLPSFLELPKIEIKERHQQQGISPDKLAFIWETMCKNLFKGNFGNLWVNLHNKEFESLMSEKANVKALKYLFPVLIDTARKCEYSFLLTITPAETAAPEMARKAGMKFRFGESETGSIGRGINLVVDKLDNFPTTRAIKTSISAVLTFRVAELSNQLFVILGKNIPASGRPLGIITGYRDIGETFEQALRREVTEESKIVIPAETVIKKLGYTTKSNDLPGCDDLNEVGVVFFELENSNFKLIQKDDSWKLIQNNTEIKAGSDLAELHVLPIDRALRRMTEGSAGYEKVACAIEAIKNDRFMNSKMVTFGGNPVPNVTFSYVQ